MLRHILCIRYFICQSSFLTSCLAAGSSPRRFIHLITAETSPIHRDRPESAPALTAEAIDKIGAYVWKQVICKDGYWVVDLVKVKSALSRAANQKNGTNNELDSLQELSTISGPTLVDEIYQECQISDHERGNIVKLREDQGESVALVASAAKIRLAITGTRLPNSKLTNTINSALEMIARSRVRGVTMTQISDRVSSLKSKAKNSAQNAFYIVKILVESGLAVKVKGMEANRSSSTIIHTKFVEGNKAYAARIAYLKVHNQFQPDESSAVSPDLQSRATTILGHDERTGLPVFAPFGSAELRVKSFVQARLVTLLRSDLWHHLIENRDILRSLVSWSAPISPSVMCSSVSQSGVRGIPLKRGQENISAVYHSFRTKRYTRARSRAQSAR